MSENEIPEDDAVQMIYDDQVEQQELDTIRKLENREEHSVLEASMVKGEPLYPHEVSRDGSVHFLCDIYFILLRCLYSTFHFMSLQYPYCWNCLSSTTT